jgi:hypothetical protein
MHDDRTGTSNTPRPLSYDPASHRDSYLGLRDSVKIADTRHYEPLRCQLSATVDFPGKRSILLPD